MNKRTMKEYRIWKAMKSRCYAPSQNKGYYKKDHIEVCERWRDNFAAFLEDMGRIPDDSYSIERIDVKGNYCPENCKWIPQRNQSKNRRNSIFVTIENKTMCLKDWARFYELKPNVVYMRVRRGWTPAQALGIERR